MTAGRWLADLTMRRGVVAGSILVVAALTLWAIRLCVEAATLAVLWWWFVVPVLAFPALSLLQALGAMAVAELLRAGDVLHDGTKLRTSWRALWVTAVRCAALLALGAALWAGFGTAEWGKP